MRFGAEAEPSPFGELGDQGTKPTPLVEEELVNSWLTLRVRRRSPISLAFSPFGERRDGAKPTLLVEDEKVEPTPCSPGEFRHGFGETDSPLGGRGGGAESTRQLGEGGRGRSLSTGGYRVGFCLTFPLAFPLGMTGRGVADSLVVR